MRLERKLLNAVDDVAINTASRAQWLELTWLLRWFIPAVYRCRRESWLSIDRSPRRSRLTDKKILIISYLFPPMGGIGVQRALSLAKYLPYCGYEVHVLKAMNAGGP